MLLESKVYIEEADGVFDIEKETIGEESYDPSPLVWCYQTWDDSKRPKELYDEWVEGQPQANPKGLFIEPYPIWERLRNLVIQTGKLQSKLWGT